MLHKSHRAVTTGRGCPLADNWPPLHSVALPFHCVTLPLHSVTLFRRTILYTALYPTSAPKHGCAFGAPCAARLVKKHPCGPRDPFPSLKDHTIHGPSAAWRGHQRVGAGTEVADHEAVHEKGRGIGDALFLRNGPRNAGNQSDI